jgi:membrane AbrB-like protein
LAILVAASAAGAIVTFKLRIPGGLLFGAMLTSAVLHGSGLIQAVLPWWVATSAMILLGAVIGARFTNTPARMLLDFLAAAFGTFAVAVTIAALFGFGLIHFLAPRIAEVIIAFAPGSVDAMMLLALALHLDPVYVGAHHVTRIFFVALIMPMVARFIARKPKSAKTDTPPRAPPPFQD